MVVGVGAGAVDVFPKMNEFVPSVGFGALKLVVPPNEPNAVVPDAGEKEPNTGGLDDESGVLEALLKAEKPVVLLAPLIIDPLGAVVALKDGPLLSLEVLVVPKPGCEVFSATAPALEKAEEAGLLAEAPKPLKVSVCLLS